ncbi:glutamate decarboxylase [Parasphingorhabdus pacifica]
MPCPQAASRGSAHPQQVSRSPGALPQQGRTASAAANAIRTRLRTDIKPETNLATFLTTSIDPEAEQLFGEYLGYNLIDRDQYPGATELEQQCVRILSELWQGDPEHVVGGATTGSSEAALLAGASLLRSWRKRRPERDPDSTPNLVLGANAHICWHKFCRYWQVEPRIAPARPGALHLTPDRARDLCDDNTIGVVSVLGSTIDGSYEPVQEISDALDHLHAKTGIDVPIHVDAASGGFVAPFLDPELAWDFRTQRVQSINASGHKYGLVPPGLGWILWRNRKARSSWLSFHTNYLGSTRSNHELSFSRSAAPVVLQYYNFLRLGFEGYRAVHERTRATAIALADDLEEMGAFQILSTGRELPVVAMTMRPGNHQRSLQELSTHLAANGWSVPVYALPHDMQDTDALRVVVRSELTPPNVEDFLSSVRSYLSGSISTPA